MTVTAFETYKSHGDGDFIDSAGIAGGDTATGGTKTIANTRGTSRVLLREAHAKEC